MSSGVTGVLAAHLLGSTLVLPHVNYTVILPELIVLGGMLVMIAAASVTTRHLPTGAFASGTVGIGIASLIASLVLWHDVDKHGPFSAVARSIDVDGFSVFILVLVSVILIVAPMFAAGFLQREGVAGCEYYALALISASGAMLMASANDLILIFLGLEILSIPLYVMAGFDQRREASGEAAMKYFILGAFSSAVFVYGIALTYGATGSTNLAQIGAFLARNVLVSNGVLLAGLALMLVGFGFKVAAVPFHMWTPDVYQGSPTPAAGFMAAIAKAGAFAALLRVFVSTLPTLRTSWQPIIWVIAVLTLLLGAVVAVVQRDVKRMLAYSSINHAGFILLGLQAATARGVAGSLYYVFVYSLLVLGSFGVVAVVGGKGDEGHDLERYRGLARRRPVLATTFALFLLAQAGAPFTTGFFAKLYVVEASVAVHSYALAVIAMVSAAIAAFFYLRVVFVMFGDLVTSPDEVRETVPPGGTRLAGAVASAAEPGARGATALATSGVATLEAAPAGTELVTAAGPAAAGELEVSPWVTAGLCCALGATIVFGIWPQPLVQFAQHATLLF
ncbi:MAG TPA: NADH-quinone oxidoreductase subunit N [Acidimicrobiales bacterium]|nr:NADH-quinone oxidoreductase subunit N [Acidimicrobiales bacterium]